jgi:hypothetical protein
MSPPAKEPKRSKMGSRQLRTSRQTRKGGQLQQQPGRSGVHAPEQHLQQHSSSTSACLRLSLLLQLLLWICRRVYADMNIKPKYRFSHLQMNPFVSVRCNSCFGAPEILFLCYIAPAFAVYARNVVRLSPSSNGIAAGAQCQQSQSSVHSCHCNLSCKQGGRPLLFLTWWCFVHSGWLLFCSLLQYEQRNKMFPHRKFARREE